MIIQWLGHASFLLISANGTRVITDPYESGAYGGGITHRPIEITPEIVTVSHGHADHGYVEGLPNHFEIVSGPGKRSVKGIDFTGVEAYHDDEQGALRGKIVMFVMKVDGIHVCHLGDLGHELTPQQAERLGSVDVLFLPVGGYYTVGPEEAARVMDSLDPKIAIPMHFKTDKVSLPIGPVDQFVRGKENVKHLESSEYEITREQLPAEREIVVLKAAL